MTARLRPRSTRRIGAAIRKVAPRIAGLSLSLSLSLLSISRAPWSVDQGGSIIFRRVLVRRDEARQFYANNAAAPRNASAWISVNVAAKCKKMRDATRDE